MIFSNILKTSFSRAVDVCSVSAGFFCGRHCCWLLLFHPTFHHFSSQKQPKHGEFSPQTPNFCTLFFSLRSGKSSSFVSEQPMASRLASRGPLCGTTGSINSWRKPMMQRWPSVAAATEVRRMASWRRRVLPKWSTFSKNEVESDPACKIAG